MGQHTPHAVNASAVSHLDPLQAAADLVASVMDDAPPPGGADTPPSGNADGAPPGGDKGNAHTWSETPPSVNLVQAAAVMQCVLVWADGVAAATTPGAVGAPCGNEAPSAQRSSTVDSTACVAAAAPLVSLLRASDAAHAAAEGSCLSTLSLAQRLDVFLEQDGTPVDCRTFVSRTLSTVFGPELMDALHVAQGEIGAEAAELEHVFRELDTDGDGYLTPGEGLLAALQVGVAGSCAAHEAALCQPMGHALLLMDQHDKGVVDRYDLMLFVHAVLAATSTARASGHRHSVSSQSTGGGRHGGGGVRRGSVESLMSVGSIGSDASSALSWAVSDSETEGGLELGRLPSPRRNTNSSASQRSGAAGGGHCAPLPPRSPRSNTTTEHPIKSEQKVLFHRAGAIADTVMVGVVGGAGGGSDLGPGLASYSALLRWYAAAPEGQLQEIVRAAVHTVPATVFRQRALDVFCIRGASGQDATTVVSACVRRLHNTATRGLAPEQGPAGTNALLPAACTMLTFDDFCDSVFRLAVLAGREDALGGLAEVEAWQQPSHVRVALLQCLFSSLELQQSTPDAPWRAHSQDVLELLWELLECNPEHTQVTSSPAATLFHVLSVDGWQVRRGALGGYLAAETGDTALGERLAAEAFETHCSASGEGGLGLDGFEAWFEEMRCKAGQAQDGEHTHAA